MSQDLLAPAEDLSSVCGDPAASVISSPARSDDTLNWDIEDLLHELASPPSMEVTAVAVTPKPNPVRTWLQSLEAGGELPNRAQLIGLLSGVLAAQEAGTPPTVEAAQIGDVKLVQGDPTPWQQGSKFPHIVDTSSPNGEEVWQQCKTKMTHVEVKLQNAAGQPVDGSKIQPGGLELELKLLNASSMEPLLDAHNPRPNEGLLLGRARGPFEPRVKLMESRHEFRFQVMLLSSDIQGSQIRVKVAPVRPDLAANESLTVVTRAFVSRARDPGPGANKRPREEDITYTDLSGLSGFDFGGEMYRSAGGFGGDDEDEDDGARVSETARVQNLDARLKLEGLLDQLESNRPMPSGRELVQALRACRIAN